MTEANGTSGPPATLLYIGGGAGGGMLREWLRQRPGACRTLFALQGRLGCELARRHAPDLVLIGDDPPDMPAREVVARIRAAGRGRTPVLLPAPRSAGELWAAIDGLPGLAPPSAAAVAPGPASGG